MEFLVLQVKETCTSHKSYFIMKAKKNKVGKLNLENVDS
jgi:hypothetical protein